jgi:tetratricopeptide (TPR) repeat protein
MEVFQQILAATPEDPTARYYLGLCYQRKKQIPDALKELEWVYQRTPDFEQTRLILGQLYISSGHAEEGRRILEQERQIREREERRSRAGYRVATRPNDPNAHRELGKLYREIGDLPRAIVELEKTLELKPDDAEARRLLDELRAKP